MGAGSQEAWCPALTTTLPSTPTPISVYEPPFPGLGGGGRCATLKLGAQRTENIGSGCSRIREQTSGKTPCLTWMNRYSPSPSETEALEGLVPQGVASLRQHGGALDVILHVHALPGPTSPHAPAFLQR